MTRLLRLTTSVLFSLSLTLFLLGSASLVPTAIGDENIYTGCDCPNGSDAECAKGTGRCPGSFSSLCPKCKCYDQNKGNPPPIYDCG